MIAKRIARIALLLGTWGAPCLMASVQVTPSTVTVNPGQTVQFTATGDPYGVYSWGFVGCGAECGTMTYSGLYTAPNVAPASQPVIVSARSWVDPTQFGTAEVTIGSQPVISVTVSPLQVSVQLEQQQLFTADVSGTTNTAVTWSVSGLGCSGTACGIISDTGVYTAPATMPSDATVKVKATSKANTSKSGTATITLFSPIAVSVSPQAAELYPGGTQQFKATVTGSTVTTVTWSITGGGCSGTGCGTISSTGLYTAPAVAPNPDTVTVRAKSTADPSASGTAAVTLLMPTGVTISPKSAVILSGQKFQFHDTVTGTTDTAVIWSVKGSSCSGTACGTISSTGLYSSPASLPAPLDVTVTVALSAASSVRDSAKVRILITQNAKLNGRYAFLFKGYDANGVRQSAGTIYADGNGKIASGFEDVNDVIDPATRLPVMGSYQITSDNRGLITIQGGPGGTQKLELALNADGMTGRLMSFDQTGIRGTGVIYKQDPSAFDASALDGGYVFSLSGVEKSGARTAAVGLIFPNGQGFVLGCGLDANEAGGEKLTFGTYSGSFDYDSDGRGTMTLKIPGFKGGMFNFVFYIVSAKQLLLLSIDPLSTANPIFSGPAVLQPPIAFDSTQLVGTGVFSLSGTMRGKEDVTVGRLNFKSDDFVIANFDRNAGGTVSTGRQIVGAYGVQVTGRTQMNLYDRADSSSLVWVMYATGPHTGVVLDMTSEAVRVGEVMPQVRPPFTNSSLVGTYMFGPGEMIVKAAPLSSGYMSFDGNVNTLGKGTLSGMEDTSVATSLFANRLVSGTYSVSTVSNNGVGMVGLTAPSAITYKVWIAGPSNAVGVQVSPTVANPTVVYFEQ